MKATCVIVADAGRARVHVLRAREAEPGTQAPVLVEVEDLINPDRRLKDSEVFSESRPGSRREMAGAPAHTFDDHRDAHSRENLRRFVAEVLAAAGRHLEAEGARRLVVAAPPAMMGMVREELAARPVGAAEVELSTKDLTTMSPTQIHEHLGAADLVPGRAVREPL